MRVASRDCPADKGGRFVSYTAHSRGECHKCDSEHKSGTKENRPYHAFYIKFIQLARQIFVNNSWGMGLVFIAGVTGYEGHKRISRVLIRSYVIKSVFWLHGGS
jgi:hypothetical protein